MTTRYQRHPNVRVTALDDEGVALQLDNHKYFTLNETGLLLLETMAQPHTVAELAAALEARYEVSNADAVRTAQAFVQQCLDRGVVVVAS